MFLKDLYSSRKPFSKYYWGEFRIKNIYKVYDCQYAVYFYEKGKMLLNQFEVVEKKEERV